MKNTNNNTQFFLYFTKNEIINIILAYNFHIRVWLRDTHFRKKK